MKEKIFVAIKVCYIEQIICEISERDLSLNF